MLSYIVDYSVFCLFASIIAKNICCFLLYLNADEKILKNNYI